MANTFTSQQFIREWLRQAPNRYDKYAPLMARIAKRESGNRKKVNNRGLNSNGTVDWGPLQVNDVWRSDPVVGRLFRNGKIQTLPGAVKAGLRILDEQGLQAWATYNPAVDRKFIGKTAVDRSARQVNDPATRVIPGVDRSEDRKRMLAQYLLSDDRYKPDGLLELAAGLEQVQDTPSRTVKVRKRVPADQGGTGGKRFNVRELFWQGPGGIDIDENQRVPQGFVSGHTDHVHVAAPPKQILKIAKIAQRMGLRVGENPAFDPVDPVHAKNSFHYRSKNVGGRQVGMAIDVSGDTAAMRRFAHRIAARRR